MAGRERAFLSQCGRVHSHSHSHSHSYRGTDVARKTNSLCRVLSLLSNKHRKAVPTLRRDSETLPSLPCARRGAEGRACRAGPGANAPGGGSRGGSWQTARSVVREPRSVALHFSGRAPRNLCRHSFLLPPCAPACSGRARSLGLALSPFRFPPKRKRSEASFILSTHPPSRRLYSLKPLPMPRC